MKVEAPEERILQYLAKTVVTRQNNITEPALRAAIAYSSDRLVAPAIAR